MAKIRLTVNGVKHARTVEDRTLLVNLLRDELGLTGTHWGCDTSNCGVCTVWLDEVPVKSCTVLAVMADGHRVRTVEGLADGDQLDPVQQGFVQCHGLQCGFCTPGMLMTTIDLLQKSPLVDDEQIREGLSGNLCRCTGYQNIVRAVRRAADELKAGQVDEAVS